MKNKELKITHNKNISNENIQEGTKIIVREVHKTFKTGDLEVRALNGINFEVEKGAFKMILGPSGCGKTTLLNVLGGLDSPDLGEIFVEGRDITKLSKQELTLYRRMKIGVIFQFYNLIPILSALENVELAARFSHIKKPKKKSTELLDRMGIGDKFKNYPNQLSGGEQQRVAIARALVKDPILILADEPTGNLDTVKSNEIYKLLKELSQEYSKTILIVTHDIDMANKYAKDHIHIRDGRIFKSTDIARRELLKNNSGD